VGEVKNKGEKRNYYTNLAWTPPTNSGKSLNHGISVNEVSTVALDIFTDTSAAAAGSSRPALSSTEGSVDGDGSTDTLVLERTKCPKAWKVPKTVERGFELPILVARNSDTIVIGEFRRIALDVYANAAWMAWSWAKQEGNDEAVSAIENLILDWPMDFILIEGDSIEEIDKNAFKWRVNMATSAERHSDFVGLDNNNMMAIIAKTAEMLQLGSDRRKNSKTVCDWLLANINWGVHHCPDPHVIERHMRNWAAFQKNDKARAVLEFAKLQFGRGNLFDVPTKVQAVVAGSDDSSLLYVCEALLTHMLRTSKDPYGVMELKKAVAEVLWVRSYQKSCIVKFPEMFKSQAESATKIPEIKQILDSPLQFYNMTEGRDRDLTWTQTLPTEALRLYVRHFMDLGKGTFNPEIKGALAGVGQDKYSLDKFQSGARVDTVFTAPFKIAYERLIAVKKAAEKVEGENNDEKSKEEPESESLGQSNIPGSQTAEAKEINRLGQVERFRKDCASFCETEIQSRLVSVIATGTASDIAKSVTDTCLYRNLTDAVSFMALYDVKNARLCNTYDGEGSHCVHRVANVAFQTLLSCCHVSSVPF
jgi:hypothetical protein